PALDVLLDQSVGADLLVDELDTLFEPRGVLHHGGLGDAERCVLDRRFHEEREAELARDTDARAALEDRELRCWNAVEGEELLAERLVARQQQAARVAAGIGLTQQL